MSTSELLQQLETCAQIIMGTPDNITVNDRTRAEEVFLNFQKTKSPFDLCREILETSKNQFVLFQTGACLKNGIIREWSLLSMEASQALFNYLFEYVNCHQLDQYVIEELMLVCAIILKRAMLDEIRNFDNQTEDVKSMIVNFFDLVKNPQSSIIVRLNASALLIQVLNEFSSLNYNSDYGLSWYSHLKVKKVFEKYLKDIFKSAIEVLFEQVKLPEEIRKTTEWIKLSSRFIRICEMILSWNFNFALDRFSIMHISVVFAKSRDRIESTVFNPPLDWIDFIVDDNLISFFFELYFTFRTIDPNLLHVSLNCLTQLSTMSPGRQLVPLKKKFAESFMENTIRLCNTLMDTISILEVVFLSNLFNSLCIYLRCHSIIYYCDSKLTENFIDLMVKLTCKVMMLSVKIKTHFDEDEFDKCNQSQENLINSFMVIVNLGSWSPMSQGLPGSTPSDPISMKNLVIWAKPLFETYVRTHLSEPEGFLPLSCFQDTDEIQEFEEDDNSLFREQLIAIGTIVQIDLLNSINTITQLLILRLQQFEACIRSEGNSDEKMIQWTRLSEDIHWILMISTYTFTSYVENDIPADVVKVSIQASPDIRATQMALQSGDFTANNIDPIVRYFIVLLKLIQLEKQLLDNNINQFVSPQVSYTLSYLISRFMHIYLVPAEFDDHGEMSLALNSCFGADSPNAKDLINFFLDHLETKFLKMSSETKVLEVSSEGLKTFCKFRERIILLQECESLQRLLQRFPFDQNFRKLNNVVRRHMYYIFTVVYTNNHDVVIDPLIQLYKLFCEHLRSGQIELVQEEFILIVDYVLGISSGLSYITFENVWKKFLMSFYNDLPQVLKVMHKCSIVVQAILELLFNFSVCFCAFFNEDDNIAFYDTAVAILNEYALHTKDTYSIDGTRLEEIQAEFIWILKFLNDLSAQDIFFLFRNSSIANSPLTSSLSQTIGKVVLTSLNIIMPLMNDQLLENEHLCLYYYKLLEFIAQDTDRFKGFPIKLFESYLKCVEYAFKANNISSEIKTIGFKILIEICVQTSTSAEPSEEVLKFLKPFFQIIIQFVFCELIRCNDPVLRDTVSVAFHSLICCFQQSYRDIIKQVMQCIGDPATEERICEMLFTMINEVGFDSRYNVTKVQFKKQFVEFINQINSLLTLR